ncbi:MAG TPA: helix-turn-helix domain-containing protein [Methanomicrobiales archaeon]|nr:helix-turn-helix domain-containing protein [Methanomicrobiales archaeon]
MEMGEDLRASVPEILKSLGFTKYEALVYVALLGMEAGTATEIHELSRVPRASVYPVLDRLVEKNLVTVSNATPKRFSAIPPEEGIENLLARIEEDAHRAKEILAEIYRKRVTVERGEEELIWSIHGEEKIAARLRDLVSGAKRSVQLFTTWPILERVLLPELARLPPSVGVEVVTGRWEGPVPPGMKVHIRHVPKGHHEHRPPDTAGIFIVDGERAMVVMGISGEPATALLSESPGFLRFFAQVLSLNLAVAGRGQ